MTTLAMEVATMPNRSDNHEAIQRLFQRLIGDFGEASGMAVVRTIVAELGGMRVTVPDHQDLYRQERNQIIRDRFNGVNYIELAILSDLSESQVRRIIHGED